MAKGDYLSLKGKGKRKLAAYIHDDFIHFAVSRTQDYLNSVPDVSKRSLPRSPSTKNDTTNVSSADQIAQNKDGKSSELENKDRGVEDKLNGQAGQPQLCECCRAIDFDDAFNSDLITSPSGRLIASLPEIASMKKSCPLCRLFLSISDAELSGIYSQRHYLRAFKLSSLETRGRVDQSKVSTVVLGVSFSFSRKRVAPKDREYCLARGVIAVLMPDIEDKLYTHSRVREVDPKNPDYSLLRHWLSHCELNHTSTCCRKQGARTIEMKCIDCHELKVTTINDGDHYFALSYVWGPVEQQGDSSSELHMGTASRLSYSGLPQVIKDAILIVTKLGGRYLWVDSYCINQQDTAQKHKQIQQMDIIYAGATATLVAADTTCAQDPIPGLSTVPRYIQPTAQVGSLRLVSTLPHISLALRESKWRTRGWTYQELMLSRRCIFFTKQQVYFACPRAIHSEALEGYSSRYESADDRTSLLDTYVLDDHELSNQRIGTKDVKRVGLWRFWYHFSCYRRRELSFEMDSLNAFRGLSSTLSFQSIWGVPVAFHGVGSQTRSSREYDIGFARGLWWKSKYWLLRLPHYPSWSWAGWKGEMYDGSSVVNRNTFHEAEACNEVIQEKFCCRFAIRLENGRRVSLQEYFEKLSPKVGDDCLTHSLFCTGMIVPIRVLGGEDETHPSKLLFNPENMQLIDTHYCVLFIDPRRDKKFCERLWNVTVSGLVLFETPDPNVGIGFTFRAFKILLLLPNDDDVTFTRIGHLGLSKNEFNRLKHIQGQTVEVT